MPLQCNQFPPWPRSIAIGPSRMVMVVLMVVVPASLRFNVGMSSPAFGGCGPGQARRSAKRRYRPASHLPTC